MMWLMSLLFPPGSLAVWQAPPGTQLHVRLTTAVGSYASKAGSPIGAVLIAPVTVDGWTVLSPGIALSGKVKTVTRVGLGIRHETAGLELEFSRLTLPDGRTIPISTRMAEVDNGRERVTQTGRIRRKRSTASASYRISGYVRTMLRWEFHSEIAEWAIRALVVKVPEPEIYYPAGVELTLSLTERLRWSASAGPAGMAREPADDELASLNRLVTTLPWRTYTPASHRPSDLTNVLLVGSREQIAAAFLAAGWAEADESSFRCRLGWLRAVAGGRGYHAAPMSSLLLNGAEAGMSWEKGLNDVSKRHHIRLWKQPGAWRGQELWIGAATRDIDFAYLRPERTLTHKIDTSIDQERDKVAYDLAFTSCADVLAWKDRPDLPQVTRNATGDPITTDRRLVVVGFNDCYAPRLSTWTTDLQPLPRRGSGLQRFARRQILSARSDLIRSNSYWRAWEGIRWTVERMRGRKQRNSGVESLFTVKKSALTAPPLR